MPLHIATELKSDQWCHFSPSRARGTDAPPRVATASEGSSRSRRYMLLDPETRAQYWWRARMGNTGSYWGVFSDMGTSGKAQSGGHCQIRISEKGK